MYLAVDCIIFGFDDDGLKLLLIRRNFEPAKGEFSLMGGFVEENESCDEAASRVLSSLTGLQNVYMQQVGAFGSVDRDPGERVVSIAYYALIDIRKRDSSLMEQHNAFWVDLHEKPHLFFDHDQMVEAALKQMRKTASDSPIAFNLLPSEFTIPQFQHLYESIFDEEMDKRNFRKKIAEMDYIEKTGNIDKTGSKRGAALYRFNARKFKKQQKFKI